MKRKSDRHGAGRGKRKFAGGGDQQAAASGLFAGGRDDHLELGQEHVHGLAGLVAAVEAAVGDGGLASGVVAVVGEDLAGLEARGLADDALALDDEAGAVGVLDDPFAAEEGDDAVGLVGDGDEIDKSVRLVWRQAFTAVVVNKFVQSGGETG